MGFEDSSKGVSVKMSYTTTLVSIVFILVSGCAQVKFPSAVNRFAIGLAETTANVKESYIVTREIEGLRGRAKLAASVLCRESGCPSLKGPALENLTVSPEVTNQVFLILAGLDGYADLLLSMGGKQLGVSPSASTKALGQHLKTSVDAVNALTPFDVGDFGKDIVSGANGAATSLGDFLNQESIKGTIPDTVEAMHPHIEAIAAFLIECIGSPTQVRKPDGTKRRSHGLRATLARNQGDISEDSIIILNTLRSNPKINDADLVKTTFRIYEQDIGRVIRSDFALAETQASLRQMVQAHKALRKPEDPATLQQVETFQFYAKRAADALVRAKSD
jgi:hypothetical protein